MQSGQRFCPYCGAENRAEADKRHKKHLDAIAEKIADLMHLPKRLTLIALRIACAVIAIGLAAYIIFLLMAWGAGHIYFNNDAKRYEKQIQTLESYYVNGQYAELAEYYERADDVYRLGYEKYRTVSDMEQYYSDAMEAYAYWKEELATAQTEKEIRDAHYRIGDCIQNTMYLLEKIEEAEAITDID